MSDDQPQYPAGPYASGPYGPGPYAYPPPAPPPAPGPRSPLRPLGARVFRRPEPRFGVTLAAAGAALVLAGVLVWSAGYLFAGLNLSFDDSTGQLTAHGDGRRFLGAGLGFALVVLGYALVLARRSGPLATAGVVLSAFGVPVTLLFLSLDLSALDRGDLPFSVDAVYLVSILVWLVSYLFVPGARGRSLYLGLVAVDLAGYLGFKAASGSTLRAAAFVTSGGSSGSGDLDTLAAIGLVFGLGYYAIAAVLDRTGRSGAAVAMIYAGFTTTAGGVLAGIPSFGVVGTGILLVCLGAILGWYGGYFGRRFTTWTWLGALFVGVVLLVGKAVPDSYTGAGIVLIVVGAVVAFVAHVIAVAAGEHSDIVEEPAS